MTLVKICGITNLEDALLCVKFGADIFGFNFYPKSLRYIEPEIARSIARQLPKDIEKVGVFVNEPIESILEIAQISEFDGIQLHGDEDHGFVKDLHAKTNLDIIKAVRKPPEMEIGNLIDYNAHSILIDSYSEDEYGGTGKRSNWEFARDFSGFWPRVFLAGGLTPENVAEAIRTVKPYAVDVASGVESSPGKKDPEKVAAFIRAAKEAL